MTTIHDRTRAVLQERYPQANINGFGRTVRTIGELGDIRLGTFTLAMRLAKAWRWCLRWWRSPT